MTTRPHNAPESTVGGVAADDARGGDVSLERVLAEVALLRRAVAEAGELLRRTHGASTFLGAPALAALRAQELSR